MNKADISEEATMTPISSLFHLTMAGVIIRLSEHRGAIWVLQSLGDQPESTRTHQPFCYCAQIADNTPYHEQGSAKVEMVICKGLGLL